MFNMLKKKISIDILVTIILFALVLLFFIMKVLSIIGVNFGETTYFAGGSSPASAFLGSLPILLVQLVPLVLGIILSVVLKRKGMVVFWIPIATFALLFVLQILSLAFI